MTSLKLVFLPRLAGTGDVGGLRVLLVNKLANDGLIVGFFKLCCNSRRTAVFCCWSTKLSAWLFKTGDAVVLSVAIALTS